MDADAARERIAAVRRDGGEVTIDELDEVWAALPAVRVEELLGSWRGGEFRTGHGFEGQLARARWHGKTFRSATDVDPIVCRGDDGRLYADEKLAGGGASLWMVEFRGESTATMVYDGRPVLDHFKRLGAGVLLGVMNGKGVVDGGRHYYFVLDKE